MNNAGLAIILAGTLVYLIGLTVSAWSSYRNGYKEGFRDGRNDGFMEGREFKKMEDDSWYRVMKAEGDDE